MGENIAELYRRVFNSRETKHSSAPDGSLVRRHVSHERRSEIISIITSRSSIAWNSKFWSIQSRIQLGIHRKRFDFFNSMMKAYSLLSANLIGIEISPSPMVRYVASYSVRQQINDKNYANMPTSRPFSAMSLLYRQSACRQLDDISP